MKKDIPIISQLLKAIIIEDYASAIEIVTSENFNPNETNCSWNAPVLTAIINISQSIEKISDKDSLKMILKEIVKNKKFDPNVVDYEGETILMHIARCPSFNWLVPFIINTGKADISIKNFMHEDAIRIAELNKNNIFIDIVLPLKIKNINKKGLPRKRKGIKNIVKNAIPDDNDEINKRIIDKIKNSFGQEFKKSAVSLYNLLISFFKKDYKTCIQIVKDPNFNPNECDRWDEPVLSSLMYYSQEENAEYDEDMFMRIASEIITNKRFDVNAIDADCNTVLMVAMGFPKLRWLAEMLFNIQSARLDIINDNGVNLREIAENCGNLEFYKHLVNKSFELIEA